MAHFILIPCQEQEDIYLAHKQLNEQIAECFKASKSDTFTVAHDNIPSDDLERVFKTRENCDIPYGTTTTLGQSGCAIYCLHQALRLKKGLQISIADLADIVASQGYYFPGRGTYHCLYDHCLEDHCLGDSSNDSSDKSHRACSIQQLYDYLSYESLPLATTLVDNSIYWGRNSGSHFVNVGGIDHVGVYIYDSEENHRIFMEHEKFIAACKVAWLW